MIDDSRLRREIHQALDARSRPAPALLARAMAAVREDGRGRELGPSSWAVIAATGVALLLVGTLLVLRLSASPPHGMAVAPDQGWPEQLTFTGAIDENVVKTLPVRGGTRSTCSGTLSRKIGVFNIDLYLPYSGGYLHVQILLHEYSGPGLYAESSGFKYEMGIKANDNPFQAWGRTADSMAVRVDPGEESGTVAATLSASASPGVDSPLIVSGGWTCKTST